MKKAGTAGIGSLVLVLWLAPSAAFPAEESRAETAQTSSVSSPQPPPEAAPTTTLDTIPLAPAIEEPPVDVASTPLRNRAIEEIVVTAQKREERLQDVPISIQAFSGDALAARGIEKTEDLGQAIPSLQFSGAVGFQLIYLRGLGTDNFIPSADPRVATYVDGIYIPNAQAAATSLGNVERVEVLKGPQGTLFGRNSTGGAISVTTKEPGNTVEASAEGELGNFDDRSAKVNLSGPITDWFSAGISGVYSRKDSYYSNLNYSADPSILKAARIKLKFQPTDDLSLRFTAFYSEQGGLGSLINKNTEPSLLGRAVGIQAEKDNYKAELDFPVGSSSEQTVFYGDLTWKLPRFDFKLMLSDIDITTQFAATDFDGSRLPIVGFDVAPNYSRPTTAELQILSNQDSWAADTFQWIAGLYYLDSRAGLDPVHFYAAPGALTSGFALAVQEVPSAVSNLVDRLPLQSTPLGVDGITVQLSGILATESYSGYTQGTYKFTDWFDLILGGRYQKEKRFLTKSTTGTVNPFNGDYIELIPWPLDSKTATTFSPRAVLSFHPRENALLYTSYAVGYKSGTFNIAAIYVPPNYIKPEKVTTLEAGAKVDFFNGLLRVNAAVFNNKIDDLQTGFVSLATSGAVLFITAPGARTRGAEIDGTLIPLPKLNPGLALTGNAA